MSRYQYIALQQTDAEGRPLDPEIYPVNTDAELRDAENALVEAGIEQAPVYALPIRPEFEPTEIDFSDAVKTSSVLFAHKGDAQ